MIYVPHAGPAVAGVSPGDPRTGIDGEREWAEGAAAASDGDIGGAGNVASGHRAGGGADAGRRGRAWTGGLGQRGIGAKA